MIDRLCMLLKMKKPEMNRGLLSASGTTVPADGTDGYQTGCVFQHTDGASGTVFYVNNGSVTSCQFDAVTTGGPADTLTIGAFSSLTAGSGIALSDGVSAAVIYGDDNGVAFGSVSIYNFRSRLLLTVDQAGASIRAVGAQLKLATGVDVATGIYTANQGYLELAGAHVAQAGATLSCVDASLEIGTSLTVDANGEACGVHVETTGAGTITNNGTCAAILIDNAAGAVEWPVGIYMPGPDVTTGLRIGDWIGSAATTHGVMFGADMDVYGDGQLDVMQVHGATSTALAGNYSAKCGRFRHVVQVAGTLEAEAYGLVGQVVAKTVVFGLYAAGLMGTIESNGGFHAGDGASTSYPCMAGVIARPSGSGITVDTGSVLAGFAALSNTNTSVTLGGTGVYPGVYVAKCQAACIAWSHGLYIADSAAATGIKIGTCATMGVNIADDTTLVLGTTVATAATKVTAEFDETTTGIGYIQLGSSTAPMVYNADPGATPQPAVDVNITHSAGAGNAGWCRAIVAKMILSGDGDTGSHLQPLLVTAEVSAPAGSNYSAEVKIIHKGTDTVSGNFFGMQCHMAVEDGNFEINNAGGAAIFNLTSDEARTVTCTSENLNVVLVKNTSTIAGIASLLKLSSAGADDPAYLAIFEGAADTALIKFQNCGANVVANTTSIDGEALQHIIKVSVNGVVGYIPIFASVPT